jgi:transposase-like protein
LLAWRGEVERFSGAVVEACGDGVEIVLTERGGETRSFHVANVTGKSLRPILAKHADRKSYLMTDESKVYPRTGDEFAGHGTVHHSKGEYVRGTFWHTNTIESHFALLKRGVIGAFHNISEAHLHRYLAEFDFRANTRSLTDAERASALLRGAQGKRLTYRQADKAQNA